MAFESLTDRLAGVFKKLRGHGKLTEADIKTAMREVRMALLEADVNYKVAKDFCAKVSERAMGQEVMESLTPAQQVVKIVNEELVALMGGSEAARLNLKNKGQNVIMLCGLQGNGKTTHAAKLAKYFIKQGRRPMLVACDIYRPAAIDQLQVVGKQAGAPVFTLPGAKPPEIARKALAHAKDYGNDIVILDTAGRLQIDEVLMQELVDIKEAVPVDETLLVVDAMAGQDAVNVAKTFNETVGVDGIILTKTDGDTRGGAALSVLAVTGKPIKFQGTGEKLDDLDVFHPDRMASRILGMGDVLTLIEKAEKAYDAKKAAEMEEKQLLDKLWDNYELSHSAAEAVRRPIESAAKSNRRIAELKKEMSSLGTPNLGAIDEYARVSERYEFLASQRDDVEKAKNELLGIISDITGEMRTIFTREFTAINESFRETFTELFGGGKAELTLEPGEDVLTCDIDIKVQPPGKALTTLSLLSGGETAFVAIALYFAIIKVRPTPFCVMDEIEAALDEANVIRFAEHMRKIANRTQFIVITHRRGTMEEADFLYGVTMQEKGVSKVIELDLDEAEKHTEEAAG